MWDPVSNADFLILRLSLCQSPLRLTLDFSVRNPDLSVNVNV